MSLKKQSFHYKLIKITQAIQTNISLPLVSKSIRYINSQYKRQTVSCKDTGTASKSS